MTIRIAITRAEPEASRTAARIRDLGGEPILTPLLAIAPRAFDANLTEVSALLFTSSNGVRAFAAAAPERNLPALCVGDATAEAARAAGFTHVASADGAGADLVALARKTLDSHKGRVLHLSGENIAHDIADELSEAGFNAERRVVYAAEASAILPHALAAPLDVILFHSARAAEIYAGFGAPNAHLRIAACLSPTVAHAAATSPTAAPTGLIPWKKLVVAPSPREHLLLREAFASAGATA